MADRSIQLRGIVTALGARGGELLVTTVHEEGLPMPLWRVALETGALSSEALPAGARDLAVSGENAFVACTDGFVHGGSPLSPLSPALDPAPRAIALLDGGRIAVLSGERLVLVQGGAEIQSLALNVEGTALAADPTGRWLVVGTGNGELAVFSFDEAGSLKAQDRAKVHEGPVTALLFEPDELRVLSTGADLRLMSTHVRGRLEPEDRGGKAMHEAPVRAMILGPEGSERRFYTAGDDGNLKAWPLGPGKKRPVTLSDGVQRTLAMALVRHKDRPHLALAFEGGLIRLFLLDAAGKAGESTLSLYQSNHWATQELAHDDVKRRREAIETLGRWKDGVSVDALANQAINDRDAELRLLAATRLGESGHPRATGHLGRLLQANDGAVRMAALRGLRAVHGQSSVVPLDLALRARKADIGAEAAKALGELARSDEAALARLVAALDEEPVEARTAALVALEGAIDPIEADLIALRSRTADLRRRAVLRLHQQGALSREDVRIAIRRRFEETDGDVRQAALLVSVLARPALAAALRYLDRSLHRQMHEVETFGEKPEDADKLPPPKKASADKLTTEDLRPLLEAMASRQLEACLFGASALATLGDVRALGTLLQLSRESKPAARVSAAKALEVLADPRAGDRLRQMLQDTAPEVRDAALSALVRLEEKDPLPAAEAALSASHEDVRRRGLQIVVKQLRAGPSDKATELLQRALQDAAPAVRSEAFKAGVNLGIGGGGVGSLRFATTSLHADIRREVSVEAMARSQEPEAWALLLDLVDDPDPALRSEVFSFLVKKKAKSLEPLARALSGRHADTRQQAAKLLAEKHTAGARELLVTALDDVELAVRRLAIDALVVAEDTDGLKKAMQSRFPDVVVRAASARAAWGDKDALAPLMRVAAETQPEQGDVNAWRDRVVTALEGLAELGLPEAEPVALAALDSKEAPIRLAAARALSAVARPDQLGALHLALRNPDANVRLEAALGLACQGDLSGASVLFGAKADASRRLRAAIGLGTAGETTLFSLFDDAQGWTRALLVAMLLEIHDPRPTPHRLLAALSSALPQVRMEAGEALQVWPDRAALSAIAVDLAGRRPQGQWKLPPEAIEALGALIAGEDRALGDRALRLLETLDSNDIAVFERAWRRFEQRFGDAIASALKTSAARDKKRKPQAEDLGPLVLGVYVGLSRQGEGADAAGIRRRALTELVDLARADTNRRSTVEPALLLALDDAHIQVRQAAFDGLKTLGVDPARVGAEALGSRHRDMAELGLRLLAEEAGGAEGLGLLRQAAIDRTDGAEEVAAGILIERLGEVEAGRILVEARSERLRIRGVDLLLTNHGKDPAAATALQAIARGSDRVLSLRAAVGLSARGDVSVFEPLVALLASDDRNEQRQAIQSLVRLGLPGTSMALLDRMEKDPAKTALIHELMQAVRSLREPASVPRLLSLALSNPDRREMALSAILAVSGHDEPVPDEEDDPDAARLDRPAQPRDDEALVKLFEMALQLGEDDLVDELVPALRTARSNAPDRVLGPLAQVGRLELQKSIIEAIGFRARKRGGPTAPLLAPLGSPDVEVRFRSAEGLALAGRSEGADVLLACVELMPELDYRQRAVKALGKLGEPRALDLLLRIVNEDGHALQEEAAEALGHLSRTPAAERIFSILTRLAGDSTGVAEHALSGLSWFGGEAAWSIIRKRAKDDDWSIRQHVAGILVRDPGLEGREVLLERVREDDDRDVVEAALRSLRQLYGNDALEPDEALVLGNMPLLDEDAVKRLAEKATADRLMRLIPRILPENAAGVRAPLVTALLSRDPLPIEAAAEALKSTEPAAIELGATVLGRVGAAASGQGAALVEATTRIRERWEKARARERGEYDDRSDLDALSTTLVRLLWALGRLGVGAEQVLSALHLEGTEAAPIRRAALLALSEGLGGTEGVQALTGAVSATDAELRSLGAAALRQRAPGVASEEAPRHLDDPAALQALVASRPPNAASLRDAAASSARQGVVLPFLVAEKDVAGLSAIAKDDAAPETVRLGAIEALGRIPDPAVDAPLQQIGTTEEDETLRKAAFRSLRRSRRLRASEARP